MTDPLTFTSGITLPDGRSVYVSIDVPRGHDSVQHDGDVLDHTEFAQMGAAHVLRALRRADSHRNARREMPF